MYSTSFPITTTTREGHYGAPQVIQSVEMIQVSQVRKRFGGKPAAKTRAHTPPPPPPLYGAGYSGKYELGLSR